MWIYVNLCDYGHLSSLPSRFAKPSSRAAKWRSLIIPTCDFRRRASTHRPLKLPPASRTDRRASLSLPQVAMPRKGIISSKPWSFKRYPEKWSFKSFESRCFESLFSRGFHIPFLGKHLKKQNKSSWNPIGTDSTEGWDPEYEPTEAVEAVRPEEVVTWNHINKGILQLRVSCSGFQHVRMMRDEVSKCHVSPEITVLG